MKSNFEELRALCAATTQPGPWTVRREPHIDDGNARFIVLDANGMWVADCGAAPKDAAFIAAARTALPELIELLETPLACGWDEPRVVGVVDGDVVVCGEDRFELDEAIARGAALIRCALEAKERNK